MPLEHAAQAERTGDADEACFARYLKDRDTADLEVLVFRHQHFAYRVAYCICGNEALAEEAVQEAMIQMVRGQIRFKSQGSGAFRAWLYRTVSNFAINLNRSERRNAMRRQSERFRQETTAAYKTRETEAAKRNQDLAETCSLMRKALCDLDNDLRLPIVLHYVDGISQTEISKLTGVSISQISRRIANGLECLRARLTAAGIGPALALPAFLGTNGLLDAPANLQTYLADLTAKGATTAYASSPRRSRRTETKASSAAAPAVLFLGLAALLLGIVWSDRTETAVELPIETPAEQPEQPALATQPTASGQDRVLWHYDFKNRPADLKLLQGRWVWREGLGMETVSELTVIVELPGPLAAEAIFTRATFTCLDNQTGKVGTLFIDGDYAVPYLSWEGSRNAPFGETDISFDQYMHGKYAINYYHEDPMSMYRFAKPFPTTRFGLGFKQLIVAGITVERIQASDLPEEFKDPEETGRLLGSTPKQAPLYRFQSNP